MDADLSKISRALEPFSWTAELWAPGVQAAFARQDHEDYLAEVWDGWMADLSLVGPRLHGVKATSRYVDESTVDESTDSQTDKREGAA